MGFGFHFRFLCRISLKVTQAFTNYNFLSCFESGLKETFPLLLLPLHYTLKFKKKPNQTETDKNSVNLKNSHISRKKKKSSSIKEHNCKYAFQCQINLGSACRLWNTHKEEDILENFQFTNVLHQQISSPLHINQKHSGMFEGPVRIHFGQRWAGVFQNLKIKY